MDYKKKRILIIGISLFLLLVLYLFKNLSNNVRVFGFILGIVIFYFIDHFFEVKYDFRHYIYIIVILGTGILLADFYFLYSIYDKTLHFLLPILGCLLFFYIIDKKDLNFQWKIFITFLFVMTFLTFHEIGEYLLDVLWDWTLQGVQVKDISGANKLNPVMSRIDDTMIDLILGFFGVMIFMIIRTISYFWKKRE